MLFSILVIFTSFLVGFSMKISGLCTYAAIVQTVHTKRIERLLIFLGTAAWATVIILPLYWMYPNDIDLSLTHPNLLLASIGGIILGLGAFLNRGCFFGTFVALVSGNINYIATLFGLSTGVIITHNYLSQTIPSTLNTTSVYEAGIGSYVWVIFMLFFAIFMTFSMKLNNNNYIKRVTGLNLLRWQSIFSMIVIGIGGALLFAMVSGWSYADVLTNTTSKLLGQQTIGATTIALLSTSSMIVGGITAAVMEKKFLISPIRVFLILGCFIGGTLMGSASMFIPGGNDGLLLKGIPSLAPHALVAYLSMIISMWILIYLFRSKDKS